MHFKLATHLFIGSVRRDSEKEYQSVNVKSSIAAQYTTEYQ